MKKGVRVLIITLIVAILSIGVIAYAAEIIITPPCDVHTFSVDSIDDTTVTYVCVECGTEEAKTKEEVSAMWNIYYVNKPVQPTDVDNSSYLDLCKDNIINAKDFAILNKF